MDDTTLLSLALDDFSTSLRPVHELCLYKLANKFVVCGKNAISVIDTLYKTREVLMNDNGDAEANKVYCFLSLARLQAIVNEWLSLYSTKIITVMTYQGDRWSNAAQISTENEVHLDEQLKSFWTALPTFQKPDRLSFAIRLSSVQNQRNCSVALYDAATNLLQCGTFSDSEGYPTLKSFLDSNTFKNEASITDDVLVRLDTASLASIGDADMEVEAFADVLKTYGISLAHAEDSNVRFFNERSSQIGSVVSDRSKRALLSLPKTHSLAVGMLFGLMNTNDLFVTNPEKSYVFAEFQLLPFMSLDENALIALNIIPNAQDTEKSMSLQGLLGQTKTLAGSKRLIQWIKAPLRCLKQIKHRHDIVECFVHCPDLVDSLRSTLALCPAIDKFTRKISKTVSSASNRGSSTLPSKAGIAELYGLYQFVSRLPSLVDSVRSVVDAMQSHEANELIANTLKDTFLDPLHTANADLASFEKMVESVVDFDAIARHEYMVKPSFDEELSDLDNERNSIMKEMEKLRTKVDQHLELGGSSVKLNHAGNLGYHFRVSRKDEKALRNKSYIPLETRKDGVRFTSPDMKTLSRSYADLTRKYISTQSVIEAKSVEVAGSFVPVFDIVADLTASLDVLLAFAHTSSHADPPYVRPEMLPSSSGVLSLTAARHPCLEVQAGVSFIANDIHLYRENENEDSTSTAQDHGRVQIVTGPNMGGKSTYIRTAGICAVMAQAGCFVPCSSAKISVLSSILARIGAGDAAHKGMSTFMKEMIEAAAIVRASTPSSLVIIDELGRGTSTYDGFGLAWAIAEHLASPNVGSFVLFATHFHELTSLASMIKTVRNKHVTATTGTGTITMLYEVKDGPCDRSFGIYVAELARFPEEVVKAARAKAKELETFGNETSNLLDIADDESQVVKKRKINHEDANLLSFLDTFGKANLQDENIITSLTTLTK